MQTINLTDYIRHGMLLKNLAANDLFDAIVYESFDNHQLDLPSEIDLHTLDQLGREFGSSGSMIALTEQYDRLLIVLDQLPSSYLLPLLSHPLNSKTTIINLHAGVSGLLAKGQTELTDVTPVLATQTPVYEAFDFVSLFELLDRPGKSYLRVPTREYIGSLLKEDDDLQTSSGLFDATDKGLQGDHATILCSPSLLPTLIEQFTYPQTPKSDVFALIEYDFQVTESLQDSLTKTKRLITILDLDSSAYLSMIKGKLRDAGIPHLSHTIITPRTTHLTATTPVILYEQAFPELDELLA